MVGPPFFCKFNNMFGARSWGVCAVGKSWDRQCKVGRVPSKSRLNNYVSWLDGVSPGDSTDFEALLLRYQTASLERWFCIRNRKKNIGRVENGYKIIGGYPFHFVRACQSYYRRPTTILQQRKESCNMNKITPIKQVSALVAIHLAINSNCSRTNQSIQNDQSQQCVR